MTQYNPDIHHRRSIRLKGYDYSQAGLYFITICTQNRACLFGEIANGEMILNDAGKMVKNEWMNLKNRFSNIELHEFIVMPNHFHGILQIVGGTLVAQNNNGENINRATTRVAPTRVAPTRVAPTRVAPTRVAPQGLPPQGLPPQGLPPQDSRRLATLLGHFNPLLP